MITAFDDTQNRAVLGSEITADEKKQELGTDVSNSYNCLFCGSQLKFSPSSDDVVGYFVHEDVECVNDGNVSLTHRLAQEIVSMRIYNLVPNCFGPIQLDIEARIGDLSDFVICDVRLSEPVQLAVEIVYLSDQISLRRRLKTFFSDNYSVMLISITTGCISPNRIQRHLQKLSSIQVGEFDPDSLNLTLGSVITPDQIDPDDAAWHLLPNYIV